MPLAIFRALALIALPAYGQFSFQLAVNSLATAAGNPPALYAGTTVGLFRSVDSGNTWTQVAILPLGAPQPSVTALTVDGSSTILAGTTGQSGSLWRSTDRGETWQNLPLPNAPEDSTVDAILAIPGAIYAVLGRTNGVDVYKSTDGGRQWTRRTTPASTSRRYAIHNANPMLHYYADSRTVYRSSDDGATWSIAGTVAFMGQTSIDGLGALAVSPSNPTNLVAGSNGPTASAHALHVSLDGGQTWRQTYSSASIRIFTHPLRPGEFRANLGVPGAQYNLSSTLGQSWRSVSVDSAFGGAPTAFTFLPGDLSTVFVGVSGRGLFRSTDEINFTRIGSYRPTLGSSRAELRYQFLRGTRQTFAEVLGFSLRENANITVSISAEVPAERWLSIRRQVATTRDLLTLDFDLSGLEPGEHRSRIRISSTETFNRNLDIPVLIEILGQTRDPYAAVTAQSIPAGSIGRFLYDAQGNPVYCDTDANEVVRVNAEGQRSVIAGGGTTSPADGVPAVQARLRPRSIAFSPGGLLHFAEEIEGLIWQVDSQENLRRVAGTRDFSILRENAPATASFLGFVRGIVFDPSGQLYIASSRGVLRVGSNGLINYFAVRPGIPLASGIVIDSDRNAYVTAAERIWRIGQDLNGEIVAGTSQEGFSGDGGSALRAQLNGPTHLVVSRDGVISFYDSGNNRIRQVQGGVIRTIAGNGAPGSPIGDCLAARLSSLGIVGGLYLSDAGELRFSTTRSIKRLRQPLAAEATSPAEFALVNAASKSRELAPGAVVTATAEGLGTIGNTLLCMNERPLPLLSFSPSTLAAQLPYGASIGTARVSLYSGNGSIGPLDVPVNNTAPGLFTMEQRAIGTNEDGSANGTDNPAPAGSVVTVMMTGQGAVTPELPDGLAAPEDPPVRPVAMLSAALGETQVEVVDSRMVAGRVGILAVLVRVPELEPGDYELKVKIGEVASNPGLIAVGAAASIP